MQALSGSALSKSGDKTGFTLQIAPPQGCQAAQHLVRARQAALLCHAQLPASQAKVNSWKGKHTQPKSRNCAQSASKEQAAHIHGEL